jgi:hypothetical protein
MHALPQLVWMVLASSMSFAACGSNPDSDDDGSGAEQKSELGESCASTGDCETDLKCIEQECVPDLPDGFCEAYAAQCAETLDDCTFDCFETTFAKSDDCWFRACGVEVGLCDGDPNEQLISQCGTDHGWN